MATSKGSAAVTETTDTAGEKKTKKERVKNPFRGVLERLAEDHMLKVECGFGDASMQSDALVKAGDDVYRVTLQKAEKKS
jgi:hypothetical protein